MPRRRIHYFSPNVRYVNPVSITKIITEMHIPHIVMMEDKLPETCEKIGLTITHQIRSNIAPAKIRVLKREVPFSSYDAEEEFIRLALKALNNINVSPLGRITTLRLPAAIDNYGTMTYINGIERYWAGCDIIVDPKKEYSVNEYAEMAMRAVHRPYDAMLSLQREETDPSNQWMLRLSMIPDYGYRYVAPCINDFVRTTRNKLQVINTHYFLSLQNR